MSRSSILSGAVLWVLLLTGPSRADSPRGIDTAAMSRNIAPGDDFYTFASGAWMEATKIPDDRGSWSDGTALAEKTAVQLKTLFEKAAAARPGSEARKVGDYYASLIDEEGIEKKGLAPLRPSLAAIDAIRDRVGLSRRLGQELRADVDPLNNAVYYTPRLFGLWVAPDLDAPERYAAYLLQGGLGLPDREYYLDDAPKLRETREKYRAHVAAVLRLAGLPGADERAARVLSLETKIAAAHAGRAESEHVLQAHNPWKRVELAARAPGLDWPAFLRAAGLARTGTIIIWQPEAIRGLSALVGSEPLEAWKDWLRYHTVIRAGERLPRAFVDETYALDRVLSGTPAIPARWKRAVDDTSAALGWAAGRLYVEAHFSPEAKRQLEVMVANITAAFRARIDTLAWMDPATRARAKEKLGTLYVGIGYPDRWPDIASLRVVRGDAYGNAERASLFRYRRALAKLGKPVDRTEWCMTPQTVNAVNLPIQNALNFPAARLQPPYFDPSASLAVNYASVGATIGHEIVHSFDDQGAQFDARGRLHDWWTAEDRAHFAAAGEKLVAQYDAYQALPDLRVNGKLTLSENIADLAGLAAAHDAWRAAQGGDGPVVDGLTGEQQFFLAFAQKWRGKLREETLRRRLITDGHAPGQYRSLTVRNLDAWYRAFDVKPGQKLYLEPAARVRVW